MKIRTTGILISFILIVTGLCLGWRALQTRYGVGVDSVRWLPAQARNITYINIPVTCSLAEFEIDQRAFEIWCEHQGRPLEKIESQDASPKDCTMGRCIPHLEALGVLAFKPEPKHESEEWAVWFEERSQRSNKQFKSGDLYFEEHWNNGGGYILGYDVNEGKGYYSYNHH